MTKKELVRLLNAEFEDDQEVFFCDENALIHTAEGSEYNVEVSSTCITLEEFDPASGFEEDDDDV